MSDSDFIEEAIEAKSDQMNAVDLITGPVDVKIVSVRPGDKEQKIIVDLEKERDDVPVRALESDKRFLQSEIAKVSLAQFLDKINPPPSTTHSAGGCSSSARPHHQGSTIPV